MQHAIIPHMSHNPNPPACRWRNFVSSARSRSRGAMAYNLRLTKRIRLQMEEGVEFASAPPPK